MPNKMTNEMDQLKFSNILFEKMKMINSGFSDVEFYEFRYALENFLLYLNNKFPETEPLSVIEKRINSPQYFESIKTSENQNGKIVFDAKIIDLTAQLFSGLVAGLYPIEWVKTHFYFDIRGFYFLVRTRYFDEAIIRHLNGKPFCSFFPAQNKLETAQAIGYKDFCEANREIDECFLQIVSRLIDQEQTPVVLALAGATAAGKTEIVERMTSHFEAKGKKVTMLELDNFLIDRQYREANGIDSLGKEALHFELFAHCFQDLLQYRQTWVPIYDFIKATSSHDLNGNLKPGAEALCVPSGDIIFIEGNSPFLLPEIARKIAIKVVYLTDDPVRIKRKWRRDMDLRKKYDLNYFRNRFFKDQFLMAQHVFIPQMSACDLVVDTTAACIWASAEVWQRLPDFEHIFS